MFAAADLHAGSPARLHVSRNHIVQPFRDDWPYPRQPCITNKSHHNPTNWLQPARWSEELQRLWRQRNLCVSTAWPSLLLPRRFHPLKNQLNHSWLSAATAHAFAIEIVIVINIDA